MLPKVPVSSKWERPHKRSSPGNNKRDACIDYEDNVRSDSRDLCAFQTRESFTVALEIISKIDSAGYDPGFCAAARRLYEGYTNGTVASIRWR